MPLCGHFRPGFHRDCSPLANGLNPKPYTYVCGGSVLLVRVHVEQGGIKKYRIIRTSGGRAVPTRAPASAEKPDRSAIRPKKSRARRARPSTAIGPTFAAFKQLAFWWIVSQW